MVFGFFKQQGRSIFTQRTLTDFSHFEMHVNFTLNPFKFPLTFQKGQEIADIPVHHDNLSFT